MAGIITTGSFAKRLWPGVKAWVGAAYKDYAPEYTEFMTEIKSDRRYEEFVSMGGMGLGVIKNEGDAVTYTDFNQGFTTRIVNVEYGLGFIITSRVQADDQYAENLARLGSKKLARSLAQTKETICANILNNGFSASTSHIGGDSTTLFTASHVRVDGGSYSNVPSSPASLSEASLEQAEIDISGFVDESGLKIQIRPKKLVIPAALKFTAKRILGNPMRPATADRDINAIYDMNIYEQGFTVNHFLTSTTKYFITTDVDPEEGLVLLSRENIDITSDNDFDTDNAKFKAKERYAADWIDARCAYGVNA